MKKFCKTDIILRYEKFNQKDLGICGYVVSVPAIPGCVTQRETFEEIMQGCLAVLKEEGEDIPQEKSDIVITKISVANPAISSI